MRNIFTVEKINYSKQNLSYTLFKNIQAEFGGIALDFNRADFRGSKFVNCRFNNNDFDRADLIDCYIEDVTFDNVNFGMSLFKNNYIKRVIFFKNKYNNLSVQESTFVDCMFNEIHINWTLTNCIFENCTFKNTVFNHSSIDLNKFIDCSFINCNMAECHMENIKFQSCTLDNVELGISYISSYLFRDTNLSRINFKYRGDVVNIDHFGEKDLDDLLSQERYFNYLNMLLLQNKTTEYYEKTQEAVEKALKLDPQQRLYNMKNILTMFEFYYDSTYIDFVTYQKIVLLLNEIDYGNLPFDESLELRSILYRINEKNNLENTSLQFLSTIKRDERCICKIHINSTDLDDVKLQLTNILKTINATAANSIIEDEKIYEIRQIEQGSIILTIASSLVLAMLLVKIAKNINHSIQVMRVEKAAADKFLEDISKAKSLKKVQSILNNAKNYALTTEENYDKTVQKLANSILISEIISIVINLIF